MRVLPVHVPHLLSEQGRRRREGHPNIQLRHRNLDTQRRELLKVGNERRGRGHLSDDEMALHADAIDRNFRGLKRFDEVEHGGSLGAGGLDVIVVDLRTTNAD